MALPSSLNTSTSSSNSTTDLSSKIKFNIPTLTIIEDFDKLIAKEVYFDETGEKYIVKLLHFPNLNPNEQKRLLMTGSSSASSDDEQEPATNDGIEKRQRKKSSKKRSLDLQRKISLNKLKEERIVENNQPSQTSVETAPVANNSTTITTTTTATNVSAVPIRHGKSHKNLRNGKISGGYEQFSMSLLTVPMPKDYCDPSSDDLSSEWDSDTATETKSNKAANKESKSAIGWRKLRNIVKWTPYFQTHKHP